MLSFWNSRIKTQITKSPEPAGHCGYSKSHTIVSSTAHSLLYVFAKVVFCTWLCLCCTCLYIVYRVSMDARELMQKQLLCSLKDEAFVKAARSLLEGAAVICCEQEVKCKQAPIHRSLPGLLSSQIYSPQRQLMLGNHCKHYPQGRL